MSNITRPGGGHQAFLALLALVRDCFDPEGYEATVFERDNEASESSLATPCSYERTSAAW